DLYGRIGGDQSKKLAAIAGDEAAQGAGQVMEHLVKPVDGLVQMASSHLASIATAGASYLPAIMDVGDKAARVVPSAADAMPVCRYLGARLVAEACVQRALKEVPADGPPAAPGAVHNPASDDIKFTTKKADKNEIVVPQTPARRGCFLFGITLLAAML